MKSNTSSVSGGQLANPKSAAAIMQQRQADYFAEIFKALSSNNLENLRLILSKPIGIRESIEIVNERDPESGKTALMFAVFNDSIEMC